MQHTILIELRDFVYLLHFAMPPISHFSIVFFKKSKFKWIAVPFSFRHRGKKSKYQIFKIDIVVCSTFDHLHHFDSRRIFRYRKKKKEKTRINSIVAIVHTIHSIAER